MTNTDALTARLRLASVRLRLLTFQVDEVGAMLAAGHISPQGALYWLWANGVDDLCLTPDDVIGDTGRAAA